MKKIIIILTLFSCFSFYITNAFINNLKEKDPLYQNIKLVSNKYKVSSINAKISGNTIRSGKFGRDINLNKSYNEMKRFGAYNESLIELSSIKPTISIEDNYDKYLIGGESSKKDIALIFIGSDISKTINILDKENVSSTFFIDGTHIEKNNNLIRNTNHEIELLSYNNSYNKSLFKNSIIYLETIKKEKNKYCYTEKDNNYLLKLCKKLNLHTIKPNIVIKNNLYYQVKNNLSNSMVISIEINNYTLKELSTTIKYIKSKGYNLVRLDDLLSEDL